MDGRQALRARMARSVRSLREQCRSEGTPEGAQGPYVGASPFWLLFGAFAKKVTHRKGESGQNCH